MNKKLKVDPNTGRLRGEIDVGGTKVGVIVTFAGKGEGAYWGAKKDWRGRPISTNFFRVIGKIASEIAKDLKKRGISVADWKEKFGQVRVYTNGLADEKQVKVYRQVHMKYKAKYPRYWRYIVAGADYAELLTNEKPTIS